MTSARNSILLALGMGLLAGLLAALGLVLLPGSATMAATEATTPDLLPGVDLVTEEIEPGVFRVIGDGVRELSHDVEFREFNEWAPPGWMYRHNARQSADISANQSGIWLRRPEGIVHLGEEGLVWSPKPGNMTPEFDVAADGTIYQRQQGRVLKEGAWTPVRPRLPGLVLSDAHGLLIAPDGTRWLRGTDGQRRGTRRPRLARHDEDGWARVGSPPIPPERAQEKPPDRIGDWGVTADGVLYVQRERDVQRFDGSRWETLERPGGAIHQLIVGADGTVWASHRDADRLTRFDGDEWTAYDVPPHLRLEGLDHAAVGLDGAYWYTPVGDPMTTGGCDGVIRTNGPATDHFLQGLCVYDIAIGPGGGLWAEATTWTGDYQNPESIGPLEMYLIAPGADA